MIAKPAGFLILLFLLTISQQSCIIAEKLQKLEADKKVSAKELEELCASLPPPPGFGVRPATKNVDLDKVFIFYDYKSADPCENTVEHYKELLEAKGWDVGNMEQKNSQGEISTSFTRDQYLVTVSCDDTPNKNDVKQQSLSCSWR